MRRRKAPKKQHRLTYRTRRRLRRCGIVLGTLAVIGFIAWLTWFLWLGRFVVYSGDGAKLDFNSDWSTGEGVEALPPESPTVQIHYNEGDNVVNTSTDLTRIDGCFTTTDMLLASVPDVAAATELLPKGSAVMLELKSIYGNFYYTSSLPDAPVTSSVDIAAVDGLIRDLKKSGAYLIARIPAFRDQYYGLNHTNYGLAVPSGGYLWADDQNCYWLNPTSTGTLAYLISIANDLRDLGFDEVVFSEFTFPPTDNIRFEGDRAAAISSAAEVLVTSCATETFAVSFESEDPAFALPEGRSRLYLTNVSATRAQQVFDECTLPIPEAQLVFRTESKDTRFDVAGVLRPMPIGEVLS